MLAVAVSLAASALAVPAPQSVPGKLATGLSQQLPIRPDAVRPQVTGLPAQMEVYQGMRVWLPGKVTSSSRLTKIYVKLEGASKPLQTVTPNATSMLLSRLTLDTSTGPLAKPGTY